MDSKEHSSILDCFGDQKAIKTSKLNTNWLEVLAKVLNMLIRLKGNNYYSKVFKRVNYKLSNSTFWVVIISSTKILTNITQSNAKTCPVWLLFITTCMKNICKNFLWMNLTCDNITTSRLSKLSFHASHIWKQISRCHHPCKAYLFEGPYFSIHLLKHFHIFAYRTRLLYSPRAHIGKMFRYEE